MKKTIIPFLILAVFLEGCGRKTVCAYGQVVPAFIGFSQADIDTLIIRAYQPNDNYHHLVDTVLITKGIWGYITSNDTTILNVNSIYPDKSYINSKNLISPGFDWQIYIPSKHRTISFSNINTERTEEYDRGCQTPINSFMQDGQLVIPPSLIYDNGSYRARGYMAYIHNN